MSKACGGPESQASASASMTVARPGASRPVVSRRLATFLRSRSMNVAWAAPRERASRPSAPLPAKRSRQRLPGTRLISQLNRVSRTRSGVGRMPPSPGKRMRRPRHSPPMMRRVWFIFCSAHPLNLRDDTRPRPPHCRSLRHEQPPCRRTPRRWLPAGGMFGLGLRRYRPHGSHLRQRRSGRFDGCRRVPSQLRAALRRAALPDRPLFRRVDRRHAELAGDAFPAERRDHQRARRFLDQRVRDRALLGADRSRDDLARERDRARGGRRQRDQGNGRRAPPARLRHRLHGSRGDDRRTPAARRSRSFR